MRANPIVAVLLAPLLWVGCQRQQPDYLPPLWCVPGQQVRHLATGKIGVVRSMAGECLTVDFSDGPLVCEPIKVVPVN